MGYAFTGLKNILPLRKSPLDAQIHQAFRYFAYKVFLHFYPHCIFTSACRCDTGTKNQVERIHCAISYYKKFMNQYDNSHS